MSEQNREPWAVVGKEEAVVHDEAEAVLERMRRVVQNYSFECKTGGRFEYRVLRVLDSVEEATITSRINDLAAEGFRVVGVAANKSHVIWTLEREAPGAKSP